MIENKIIVIITTRNRPGLLERALVAAINQDKKPDHIMISSDSNDPIIIKQEKNIALRHRIQYIQNKRAHNCSGVRNNAIIKYINDHLLDLRSFSQTYIAFLDDDDFWDPSYIRKCYRQISSSPDFIVTGLIFNDKYSERKLHIYESFCINDFLKGNPHIQGSNIFIKLSILLKSGMFDENMCSSVDRDLFVRVFQLAPVYQVVQEHLVSVDVNNDRERVTNNFDNKRRDIEIFYKKYSGIMSESIRRYFWERNERLFGIREQDIFLKKEVPEEVKEAERNTNIIHSLEFRVVIGIIITKKEQGLRLINDIIKQTLSQIKVIIIKNYEGPFYDEIYELLHDAGVDFFINDVGTVIQSINSSRNLLFCTLRKNVLKGDVIWILDDDMELKYISSNGQLKQIDIENVILNYIGKYDAIVGDYTLDPPLPVLSTLRTKLLDYTYHYCLNYEGNICLDNMSDYYYDLSERTGEHLETPFFNNTDFSLKDIFSGKAGARPLFLINHRPRYASFCGGNILIFNPDLLYIQPLSLSISGIKARRSDYLWVLESIRKGYSIANVSFATLHNRSVQEFKYEKEEEKLISDIVGATCTKTIERIRAQDDLSTVLDTHIDFINARVTMIIVSYFRIIGLLQVINDITYKVLFTENNLYALVEKIINISNNEMFRLEWNRLINHIYCYKNE